MRFAGTRLFAVSLLTLAACAAKPPHPATTNAGAQPQPAPVVGAAAKPAEPGVTSEGTESVALEPSDVKDGPSAGKGTKESFDGPPGLPTTLPTSIPGLPPLPGAAGGNSPTPMPAGGDDLSSALNFKLPPCPPTYGMTFGAGVAGTILMPKGDMALGAAKVTLVNAIGVEQATTVSDGCGRFRFDAVLPGVYKVKFQVRTFKGEQNVNVPPGGTSVELRVDVKFLQIAVFKGAWDHVENILDKVGVPYQIMPNNKLESTDLSKFNVVFINCNEANEATVSATVKEKLKAYVGGGGALYVSDRALPYILATWPGQVKAKGNTGGSGTKKHTVFDFQMGSYLRGVMSVPIIYDMGAWRQLEKEQPATTFTFLRDEKTQEPAIITFGYQGGFVGYTTYHQGAQMNDAMTFSLVFFITRL